MLTAAGRETRIQLCGRLVVRLDGRRLESEFPGRQGRLAFVYLVVNRLRAVSRDELIDALWPVQSPAMAATALSAILSKLRRALGAGVLDGRSEPHLTLPTDAWVDLEAANEAIHRAESAVARADWPAVWGPGRVALHIARRGFLKDEDAPWINELQHDLSDLELRALECVGESALGIAGAELDAALRSGRTLVRAAPHRESGYRLLMRALREEGNVAEALSVYDSLRVRLREDFGVAPSATTQELYRALIA